MGSSDVEHQTIWRREGDRVILEMNLVEYAELLVALGYATGAAFRQGDLPLADQFTALVNRLNEGNPEFRAYKIP